MVLEAKELIIIQLEQLVGPPMANIQYIGATIVSGDGSGYWMSSNNVYHPEYIHHSTVDGSNTYGVAINAFPRRLIVGGAYANNSACGSRSIVANCSTARLIIDFS